MPHHAHSGQYQSPAGTFASFTQLCRHTHMHHDMHTHTYIHTCTALTKPVHTSKLKCMHTHKHMPTQRACVYAHARARAHKHTHIQSMHTCTCPRARTHMHGRARTRWKSLSQPFFAFFDADSGPQTMCLFRNSLPLPHTPQRSRLQPSQNQSPAGADCDTVKQTHAHNRRVRSLRCTLCETTQPTRYPYRLKAWGDRKGQK
jgi:hypothetical protein